MDVHPNLLLVDLPFPVTSTTFSSFSRASLFLTSSLIAHTLISFSVAAAINGRRGWNAIELIVDPASYSYLGFLKSVISQTYNFLSFPPVAIKLPYNGETATALILFSWALNENLIE